MDPLNSSHHLNCSLHAIDWHIPGSQLFITTVNEHGYQMHGLLDSQFKVISVLQDDNFTIFGENSDPAL